MGLREKSKRTPLRATHVRRILGQTHADMSISMIWFSMATICMLQPSAMLTPHVNCTDSNSLQQGNLHCKIYILHVHLQLKLKLVPGCRRQHCICLDYSNKSAELYWNDCRSNYIPGHEQNSATASRRAFVLKSRDCSKEALRSQSYQSISKVGQAVWSVFRFDESTPGDVDQWCLM